MGSTSGGAGVESNKGGPNLAKEAGIGAWFAPSRAWGLVQYQRLLLALYMPCTVAGASTKRAYLLRTAWALRSSLALRALQSTGRRTTASDFAEVPRRRRVRFRRADGALAWRILNRSVPIDEITPILGKVKRKLRL